MSTRAARTLAWAEPLAVAAGLADRDGVLCLLSDGGANGRFSFVAAEPDRVVVGPLSADGLAEAGPRLDRQTVALIAYDWGARPATGARDGIWPDLMLARYPAMLRFDHATRTVQALALGDDPAGAERALERTASWLNAAQEPKIVDPPGCGFEAELDDQGYRAAVADVVARIASGELFQANIARAWTGPLRSGADPFQAFVRLARGPAPYAAFWRIGGRAVVSNSPELFLTFDPSDRRVETRPIKGTRARMVDPAADAAQVADLLASAKDRAENLMIVDLMRNDLARVSEPGSVEVERLFALESFATVHHLVSTVSAKAGAGISAAEVLQATFPPGSITGAPKHQAMKVIAVHEPPRGAWCGSLVLVDDQARMTASVLIRTIAFWREGESWRFRTQAGAGIVADSEPEAELAETEAKIAAVRQALVG